MIHYEIVTIDIGYKVIENVKATFDDSDEVLMIPTDPANSDYQAYLASLDEPTKS